MLRWKPAQAVYIPLPDMAPTTLRPAFATICRSSALLTQSNQTSYELVKAFMGPFKAGFYQTFAALFGASLKKEYDPQGEDKLTERVVLMVENGQI